MYFIHWNCFRKLLHILRSHKAKEHKPCIFLLWNRGLPKKLFLMLVSLVFQSCCPEAGQVDPVIEADCAFIWGDPGGVITENTRNIRITISKFIFDRDIPLLLSRSWNILIAIVGPELALWWAGDELFDSLLLVFDGVRFTGVGECVECLVEAWVVAGDDGLDMVVDWVIEIGDPLRVGLWYDEDLIEDADDVERLWFALELL